jgi:hypothetical protein
MTQPFRVDENGMLARSDHIIAMAILCLKEVSGAYYSSHAPEKSACRPLILTRGRLYPFHPTVTLSS